MFSFSLNQVLDVFDDKNSGTPRKSTRIIFFLLVMFLYLDNILIYYLNKSVLHTNWKMLQDNYSLGYCLLFVIIFICCSDILMGFILILMEWLLSHIITSSNHDKAISNDKNHIKMLLFFIILMIFNIILWLQGQETASKVIYDYVVSDQHEVEKTFMSYFIVITSCYAIRNVYYDIK